MEVGSRRRIRISFSDPDATDSDSDGEDARSPSCGGKTTKIVIFHCSTSSVTSARKTKQNPGGCGSSQQKQAMAVRSSSAAAASCRDGVKRCRGVYERQPGRWAAEFRSLRLKARHWIGTFDTEEEAKAAYDDFERQFFVPSSRRCCGLPPPPPALERGHGVHRASSHPLGGPHRQRHHPRETTEKRQIVQALAATGIMLPPLPSSAAPASAPPCVSNSTSASRLPPPPLVPAPPPVLFENAELHGDAPPPVLFENAELHGDAPPSVHSFWADDPADDEDLIGLADLGHLPLPFSDPSMDDFDPADLSLFDGFFS